MRLLDGLPVVNATEKIVIDISSTDVRLADRKKPQSCAIARCCRRQLNAKDVRVHLGRIYVRTNNDQWLRYLTNPYLRQEIIAFDRGGEFMPGEYPLSPVPPAKRQGTRQGTQQRNKTGKRREAGRQVLNVRVASPLGPQRDA